MSQTIKVAVMGTGSLGKEHVRIYAELAKAGRVQLVGVYDASADTAQKIAAKHGVRAFGSVAEAAAASDALSLVTPTTTHFELAKKLLQQGKHVLVEKPMTDNAAQAAELVQLAQQKKCVLQVGHVERFNPVFNYLETVATDPRFIETHRLSPYPARSTDIGVVLDLMIHDLDVVLAFVKSPVTSVDAVGIPVLSKSEDIANARLRFANGCVANLTASRVSPERMRKIRVFSGGAMTSYVSLDYRAQEGYIYRIARDGEEESSLLEEIAARRRIPPSSANSAANASCANRCRSKKRTAESWNCKASSIACMRGKRRWSAANPPSRRWIWLLKSRGRFRRESASSIRLGIMGLILHPSTCRSGDLWHRVHQSMVASRQLRCQMVGELSAFPRVPDLLLGLWFTLVLQYNVPTPHLRISHSAQIFAKTTG